MTTTSAQYIAALNACNSRIQYINEVARPALLAAQAAAMKFADDDESIESCIAWSEVAAIGAKIAHIQSEADHYLELSSDLRDKMYGSDL